MFSLPRLIKPVCLLFYLMHVNSNWIDAQKSSQLKEFHLAVKIYTAWKVSKYGVISGPYSVQIRENTDQK